MGPAIAVDGLVVMSCCNSSSRIGSWRMAMLLKSFFGNIRDARVSLEIFWGGPELLERLEKQISVKKHGFWSTYRGGRRGQNFLGVVWGV